VEAAGQQQAEGEFELSWDYAEGVLVKCE
jgi:hypothetical protein